ncbi:MAG TPA: AAA family ATPase [Thermomicrobiales bacterium]
MNCPGCARSITDNAAHCPFCGADLRDANLTGSDVLRPQVLPAVGDQLAYREPKLVDHEHTLRRLRGAWRLSLGGQGHLVSLVGENGSGRSRLIRELGSIIDADAADAHWLVSQAHSYATYQPMSLLADLLAPWAAEVSASDVSTRLATALVTLAEGASAQERWTLLALARDVRDANDRDELTKLPLAEALAAALRRAVGAVPLVVVLEDLEWADAASLAVLDTLLPRLLSGAVLVIYTHHADWSHEWPDISRHAQLFLGSLSRPDSLRLVAEVAGAQELPPELMEAIAVGSHGNPLLIEHATLSVIEADLRDPALAPITLQAAIRSRIATLPDPVRDVLLAGAILGQRFAYRAIAMVTEPTVDESRSLDAALRELSARRLITRWREGPEVTYQFTHALIQEVAYGMIRRAERQVLEARVADWLLTEGALNQRGVATVLDDLDQLIAQAPAADEPVESDGPVAEMTSATASRGAELLHLPRGEKQRAEVLARIVLADLPADRRASLVLCLEHGYSYAQAGEMLGVSRETVRDHLYEARQMFKRLHDASGLTIGDRSTEGAR